MSKVKRYYKFKKNPRWTGGVQIMRIGYRYKWGGFDSAKAILTFRWHPFFFKVKKFWG